MPQWLSQLVMKTKTVKKKPAMPWYNDEIKGLKRDRRKADDNGCSTEVTP